MSATRSTRRSVVARSVAATAAAAAVLLLAGCGSGQVGTIGGQVAAVNGGQAEAGSLSVRNVTMEYPAEGDRYETGSEVPVLFTITNAGVATDRLTSITTSAGTVELDGTTDIAGQSSLVSSAQEQASSSTSVPFSETPGKLHARITSSTEEIVPGLNVQMTFTFASSGSVTVPVPLAYDDTERAATSEG